MYKRIRRMGGRVLRKGRVLSGRLSAQAVLERFRPRAAAPELSVSVIIPAYNVEKYIDVLLGSIFGQSCSIERMEVIVVDDGSTDGTANRVREWCDRYPQQIRCVHQKNAGLSAARNTGLALATGTWVTFPDPDDFLDVDYFKAVVAELRREHRKPLLAVCCNQVYYIESSETFRETHPLRFRFASGVQRKTSDDLGQFMQLSANSIWIRQTAITQHGLTFDPRVFPSFEDGHLLNRVLILNPHQTVTFLPSANTSIGSEQTKPPSSTTRRGVPLGFSTMSGMASSIF